MEKIKDFSKCRCFPIISMRLFCIQCMGGQHAEVKKCSSKNCPLYPYRMKHRPKHAKTISYAEGLSIMQRTL